MASLSNSRWQNHRERLNGSTNNGGMVEKAKRYSMMIPEQNSIILTKMSVRPI